jgi:hypothetical protein
MEQIEREFPGKSAVEKANKIVQYFEAVSFKLLQEFRIQNAS